MDKILQLEEAVLQREEEVELLRRKGRALGGDAGPPWGDAGFQSARCGITVCRRAHTPERPSP